KLKIRVESAESGFNLMLDGRPLRPAALGSLIPLDPGDHTVEATAPGKARWLERVKIDRGPATQELVVKLVDAPPSPPSNPAAPEPAPPSPSTPQNTPEPAQPSTMRRDVGFAIGALGLVGIGVGTGYGLWALSQKDAYQQWSGGCVPGPDCDDAIA